MSLVPGQSGMPAGAGPQLTAEAANLLHLEAWLLDQGRLDQWLGLYTSDATYWIPLEAGQSDPLEVSSILYDDITLLKVRVKQYADARAHARRPAARTVHQVGNVMVSHSADQVLGVTSTLVVVEYRLERQRIWGASVQHELRRTPEGLRICSKRVDLVNSESELDGINILF